MRVYYTASDNGDGSASVHFFESQEVIDLLEEFDPETYGSGEGGNYFDVPDLGDIPVETLEEVSSYLINLDCATQEQIDKFLGKS